MRLRLMVLAVLAVVAVTAAMTMQAAQKSESAKVMFEAAKKRELVDGDLKGAIQQYKAIVGKFGKDRSIAADALLRMANCYERLRDLEAQKIYDRIVREFADQTSAAAEARQRLAASTAPGSPKLMARQILDGPGVNGSFDVTADGRFLIQTDFEKTGDIVIRNVSTGELRRLMLKTQTLLENSEFAENPIFSPDEREIAFAWFDGGRYQLRLMPNQPGARPRILVNVPEVTYFYPAGWSRDGGSLLATMWKTDNTAQFIWVSLRDGAVRTLKSLEWRQPSDRPRLSPDGRFIAYSARQRSDTADRRDIYLLAADGSSETVLISGGSITEDPTWTPDGQYVLFTSDRSGSFALWAIAVREGKGIGEPFLVKPDLGKSYLIGITRDGSVYHMTDRGGDDVFVADFAPDKGRVTGVPVRLTDKFIGANRSPSWSPDGNFIAFKRSVLRNSYDVVVQSVKTGEEKTYPIPFRTRPVPRPLWFPDSRTILLDIIDNRGRNGYIRIDLDSGNYTEAIAPSQDLMQWATLSPDAQTVYIVKWLRTETQNTRSIAAFDLATGRERIVYTDADAGLSGVSVSPDGRQLAITKSVRTGGRLQSVVALLDVDGNHYREIAGNETGTGAAGLLVGGAGMLAWMRDGGSILFGTVEGERESKIIRIPIDSGKPEYAGLTVARRPQGFDISSDGSRIAFANGSGPTKEIWVLQNVMPALTVRSGSK
jgi:Tol biopolymer transport system component